jgi:undecaprenyl-diphosphatase
LFNALRQKSKKTGQMIEELIEWDKKALIFMNSFHSPVLDPLMFLITKTTFWIPLYAFLIFLLFRNYKQDTWFILIGVVITILLSDQITSSLMKPLFARLRPSHDPTIQNILHLVNDYRGGLYGFASSHASNSFATAIFVWLALKPFYRWVGLIFLWAFIMTYTRIYLGVHFPGDILVGALVGLVCGWIGFKTGMFIKNKRASQNNSGSSQLSD